MHTETLWAKVRHKQSKSDIKPLKAVRLARRFDSFKTKVIHLHKSNEDAQAKASESSDTLQKRA